MIFNEIKYHVNTSWVCWWGGCRGGIPPVSAPASVYIATTASNCGCEFRSVSAEPLAANRGTQRFRGTTVERHCPNVIKFQLRPV